MSGKPWQTLINGVVSWTPGSFCEGYMFRIWMSLFYQMILLLIHYHDSARGSLQDTSAWSRDSWLISPEKLGPMMQGNWPSPFMNNDMGMSMNYRYCAYSVQLAYGVSINNHSGGSGGGGAWHNRCIPPPKKKKKKNQITFDIPFCIILLKNKAKTAWQSS